MKEDSMARLLGTTRFGRLLALAVFSVVAGGGACFGQAGGAAAPAAATGYSKPASTNISGQRYPSVDSQMRVTFSIRAATAQKVQILLSNPLDPQTPFDMTNDGSGTWTLTSAP